MFAATVLVSLLLAALLALAALRKLSHQERIVQTLIFQPGASDWR
jgi:Tfp pilus assembly protein PilX